MFYPKLEGVPLEAHRATVNKLKELAKTELKLGDEGIVTRGLRPEDLGLTGRWSFVVTSTSGYHTMVNASTIANTRFISLEGVFYPKSSPQLITQLEINRAGSIVRYWNIQGVNFLQDNMIFFDDPVTLGQNQPITIRGYNPTTSTNAAASPEEVVLIGTVVEKKGLTVND